MMKQVAFAAITAFAAARSPKLIVSYNDTQNYFLGLEHDNPASMKLPRDYRAHNSECTGWRLQDEAAQYDSFTLKVISREDSPNGCSSLLFTAASDADVYERESVVFVNDCGEEEETLIVNVQVYDNYDATTDDV